MPKGYPSNLSPSEKKEVKRRQIQAYHRRLRIAALAAYGNACQCCGETTYEFLAIDHTDGGGNEHRREIGSGSRLLYRWLAKHEYPDGFRVLCHNCNSARGYYGFCPHERHI